MAFSPPEYCRLFAKKKAYQRGVTGTPGPPPLATPLDRAPFYLVLRFQALRSESVTLFKAASEKVIQDVAMCTNILKQTCEILMFIHERGFLHNDLKSNNVVIDGSETKPVIIDFGESCKIVKARLRKPKVNIEKSMKKFPHIAPEIHGGERQSIASDAFSFGYLVTRLFEDAKLEIPPVLKEVAKKCQSSIPGNWSTFSPS